MMDCRAEEALEIIGRLLDDVGLAYIGDMVRNISDDGDVSDIIALKEACEKFYNFDTQRKRRMIEFGDENKFAVMRYYIVSVKSDWDTSSRPIIILNPMPEEVTLKDNPIKNIILQYESDEVRDRDYSRLRLILG
jgi:hypothetical protein